MGFNSAFKGLMTIFSASLTNHMLLLSQSGDSSHHLSEAKCPRWLTQLLLLLRWVDNTDHLVSQESPGSTLLVLWLLMCHSSI